MDRESGLPPAASNQYTCLARLGCGGQAEILLAVQHGAGNFEKLIVIKRLLPHLAGDAGSQRRLEQEARLVARIQHPNVCQVLNIIESSRGPLLVLEYLDGVTMTVVSQSLPRVRTTTEVRFVAGVLQQVCEGLNYAHDLKEADGSHAKLVHRDVSGNNIIVTRDGVAKVLDFGIAKAASSERSTVRSVVGTAAFMSPEQVRGEPLDGRSDLFSLGIVAYEGLTGKGLFRRASIESTFEAVAYDEPPPMTVEQPQIPVALESVVMKALSKNRERRFGHAREFGDAIGEAAAEVGGAMRLSEISDYVQTQFSAEISDRHERVAMVQSRRPGGDSEVATAIEGWDTDSFCTLPAVDLTLGDLDLLSAATKDAASGISNGATKRESPSAKASELSTRGTLPRSNSDLGLDATVLADSAEIFGESPRAVAETAPIHRPRWRRLRNAAMIASLLLIVVAIERWWDSPASSQVAIRESPAQNAVEKIDAGTRTHKSAPSAAVVVASRLDAGERRPPAPPTTTQSRERRNTPKRRRPKREAVADVKTTAEAEKPGFFSVDSVPYSTIRIDGRLVGRVPIYRLPLKPGKHRVVAKSDDGPIRRFTVTIRSGQDLRKRINW